MSDTQFHHVGIINRYHTTSISQTLSTLIDVLRKRNIPYVLDIANAPIEMRALTNALSIDKWPDSVDLAIVIGGDGTFLYAGRNLHTKNIPIVGINTGNLGFLADISAKNVESEINQILDGDCILEQRRLLSVRIERDGAVRKHFYAVNDLVVNKRLRTRMVELDLYVHNEFLCHYHADGLIIATPTGSTAYVLSAGGPILSPTMDAFIVTPICPHALGHRPVVVDIHSEVRVVPTKNTLDIQVTIDGQEEYPLTYRDRVLATDGGELTVLHPKNYNFQKRLREKLRWGVQPIED